MSFNLINMQKTIILRPKLFKKNNFRIKNKNTHTRVST